MMQSDMGVEAGKPGNERERQALKCSKGIVPECRKQKVEPNHVRIDFADALENFARALAVVEIPATNDIGLIVLCVRDGVCQHRKA
jgi:hypothetical protein